MGKTNKRRKPGTSGNPAKRSAAVRLQHDLGSVISEFEEIERIEEIEKDLQGEIWMLNVYAVSSIAVATGNDDVEMTVGDLQVSASTVKAAWSAYQETFLRNRRYDVHTPQSWRSAIELETRRELLRQAFFGYSKKKSKYTDDQRDWTELVIEELEEANVLEFALLMRGLSSFTAEGTIDRLIKLAPNYLVEVLGQNLPDGLAEDAKQATVLQPHRQS
jgi:hypothetical protein